MLDPFCGCGTTIYAVYDLNINDKKGKERIEKGSIKWIGMYIVILSTRLVRDQLIDKHDLKEGIDFEIAGIPVSVDQAKDLWERDPFRFQNWAVEYVLGFCTNKKTRGWGGDGRLYFQTVRREQSN